MRVKKNSTSMTKKSKTIRLKTTLFDLFSGLIDGDINDAAVLASVRQIFARYDVRLARTLTPLRLAASSKSVQRTNNHSKNALRWA